MTTYFAIFSHYTLNMRNIRLLFLWLFLLTGHGLIAQETFIIEGDTLELQEEVKGPLSLYWTVEDNNYRYFVQKKNRMLELRDTRTEGEPRLFREQLEKLTADTEISTEEVSFELYSLRNFVNRYNAKVQEDYEFNKGTANIQHRIGLYSGLSNNRYTYNTDNVLVPILGVEYEFLDPSLAPRHSGFIQLRHSFKREDYRYSSTQLSLNYRFKILYFSKFSVHLDSELATLTYSEDRIRIRNEAGEITAIEDEKGFSFNAPLSFGIGTDIRITDNGYITLSYNDVVSIVLDSNGSFPIYFTIGYKYCR